MMERNLYISICEVDKDGNIMPGFEAITTGLVGSR